MPIPQEPGTKRIGGHRFEPPMRKFRITFNQSRMGHILSRAPRVIECHNVCFMGGFVVFSNGAEAHVKRDVLGYSMNMVDSVEEITGDDTNGI